MTAPDWVTTTYGIVDAEDMENLLPLFTPGAELRFGNNPAAIGHDAIRGMLGEFWSSIGGLRHEFVNVVGDGPTSIEAICHYTTRAGTPVPLPVVTQIDRDGAGLITSMRVYIDSAPLFAQIASEADASS
ncbi:nuclear transport factor 2 family protein [Tsukamurella spumae]|uniref:Nuclear transport factor 2 family protein n=1 Tax=Tsukamurella spumae TaxID=44753 RepID=A0A846X5A1_9ACTN|nr:nuclear transport factor 2 family protein [Tsukamurella spumae]NKY19775.1 nuclear transport factor 2 family protein [Tsukamurella spumae]